MSSVNAKYISRGVSSTEQGGVISHERRSEVRRRRAIRGELGTTVASECVQFVEVIPTPCATADVPDSQSATHRHSQITIVVSRGRQIEVAPGFDEETLARTLRVVEMTPC